MSTWLYMVSHELYTTTYTTAELKIVYNASVDTIWTTGKYFWIPFAFNVFSSKCQTLLRYICPVCRVFNQTVSRTLQATIDSMLLLKFFFRVSIGKKHSVNIAHRIQLQVNIRDIWVLQQLKNNFCPTMYLLFHKH